MFFDGINSPLNPSFVSNLVDRFFNIRDDRHSFGPIDDIFETVNKEFDAAFADVRSSHRFNEGRMSSNNPGRNGIRNNPRSRREYGVTLNGEVVERTQENNRPFRHAAHDPVQIEPSRLQWYDSNTRRTLLPPPPPRTSLPRRSLPWLSVAEMNKLPLTTYRTLRPPAPPTSSGDDSPDSRDNQGIASSSEGATVTSHPKVDVRTENGQGQLPTSYLVPVSRTNNLVPIKPLVSSPSSGAPECEVCLGEYQDKDRIRHLPCGHAFHVDCIDPWLRQATTCPKCRARVKAGIRRLEVAQCESLMRTVSLPRQSRVVNRWVQPIPARASASLQQRRPAVAAPVAVIRQGPRQPVEIPVDRVSPQQSEEARRKAGEAAIRRAAAAAATTTTTTNH